MKQFFEWIKLKEKLHNKGHKAPFVSEGNLWWASIGENVGFEINGKGKVFSRPVIILEKLTHGFYLVIPTTTQRRVGNWFVTFRHKGVKETACLHQIRSLDYRRFFSKMGRLDDEDFEKIKRKFRNLYL